MKALPSPKPKGRAGGTACVLRCHLQCVLQSRRHRVTIQCHGAQEAAYCEPRSTDSYRKIEIKLTKLRGHWGGGVSLGRAVKGHLGEDSVCWLKYQQHKQEGLGLDPQHSMFLKCLC